METDVPGERVEVTELRDGIQLSACEPGYLYRITSFWGDDGHYFTHEFITE